MPEYIPPPKRTQYTHWWNHEPIADVHEALCLLASESSASMPKHLSRTTDGDWGWEVVSPWYREGSSGGDTFGTDYYQIDDSVADELIARKLVEPHRVVIPGSTTLDETRLVISAEGKEVRREHIRTMEKKALSMLVPGLHTDLTGDPARRGYGRAHGNYGPLRFRFTAPQVDDADAEVNDSNIVRVYPELDQILLPEPRAKAA